MTMNGSVCCDCGGGACGSDQQNVNGSDLDRDHE